MMIFILNLCLVHIKVSLLGRSTEGTMIQVSEMGHQLSTFDEDTFARLRVPELCGLGYDLYP
jgi:hypothetical protein